VGECAAGTSSDAVPVPVGAVRLEMCQGTTGSVQVRLEAVHHEPEQAPSPGPDHRADKRRQHGAGAALGQKLPQGGRPGDRVRDRWPSGAELVLGGGRLPLHRARAQRGQLRAVRGRPEGDRREGTGGRLRTHRRYRIGVLRRGGQAAPGTARVSVLDSRAGRCCVAQRPV